MCQIHHIRLSLSVYCIKIEVPIPREGFPSKRPADVKDIFDHSYAEAILKRVFNHQNKEVEKTTTKNKKKKTLKPFEYATRNMLTNFEILTFVPCIYTIVLNNVSNRYFLNHVCVCLAVWCLPTC